MITEDDLARLPRWQISEPNHAEFQKFKKEFLLKKAQTTKEKELLRYIGELQSEIDTLKHSLATCQKMTPGEYKTFIKEMIQVEANANFSDKATSRRAMRKQIDRMREVLLAHNLTW